MVLHDEGGSGGQEGGGDWALRMPLVGCVMEGGIGCTTFGTDPDPPRAPRMLTPPGEAVMSPPALKNSLIIQVSDRLIYLIMRGNGANLPWVEEPSTASAVMPSSSLLILVTCQHLNP